jgi:hypothetical protein
VSGLGVSGNACAPPRLPERSFSGGPAKPGTSRLEAVVVRGPRPSGKEGGLPRLSILPGDWEWLLACSRPPNLGFSLWAPKGQAPLRPQVFGGAGQPEVIGVRVSRVPAWGIPYSPNAMPQRPRKAFHAAEVIERDPGFRPWQMRSGGQSTSTVGVTNVQVRHSAERPRMSIFAAGRQARWAGSRAGARPSSLAGLRSSPRYSVGSHSYLHGLSRFSASRRPTMSWPRRPKRRLTTRSLIPRLRPR